MFWRDFARFWRYLAKYKGIFWQFTMGGKSGECLAPPPGYAKIDADLNAGAFFGEKITLCVRPTPLKNGGDHSFTTVFGRYGTAFWCRFSGSWRNKKKANKWRKNEQK